MDLGQGAAPLRVACHSRPLDMLAVTWAGCSSLSLGSVFWVSRPPPHSSTGRKGPLSQRAGSIPGRGQNKAQGDAHPQGQWGGRRRFNWAELMSLSTRRKAKSPKRLCWNLVHFTMYLVHFENILPFQI